MESEARESGTAGVARSQNAVYVMPHDWASMSQFLEPLVERVDDSAGTLQLLVVTADPDSAAAAAAATVRLASNRDIRIVAATSPARAARLIRLRTPQILAGDAATLVALVRNASLKLDSVRSICIAWVDELLARGATPSLESLMTDLSKDAARTIVTAEVSPGVDEVIERYARRARRVASPASEQSAPVPIEYVAVSYHGRLAALRRVLDETDPGSALIFVRDDAAEREVRDMLRTSGPGDESVHVGLAAPPGTELVVLFDLPASREEMREAASSARRAVALVQPRQLTSLRALAAGGNVKPLTLPQAGQRARDGEAELRLEVRRVLEESRFGRELLALEPLLEDYDGIEIGAALLQMLERDRHAHRAALASVPTGHRDPGSMTRLFIGVGSRDDVRPSDLVGAIANQGGISGGELGRVDIRESHSIVEVSATAAEAVIEKVNGTVIKGRRAVVRADKQPTGEGRRESGSRDRRPSGGPRGGRGDFRDRGERGGRGERGDRGARGDRGDRSDRGSPGARRPPRPHPPRGDE
ncbi:MAG TPA: DbpA RNA binding domain-containing protein [Gemmatimonadaceae bacterium]|nr:DbpA RNA binding domain-containing protein [Gemmatimonadaceae bacterium]